jgi:hypothetical protein
MGLIVLQKRITLSQCDFEIQLLSSGTYIVRAINEKTGEIINKMFQK